jgi:hypothetical protein
MASNNPTPWKKILGIALTAIVALAAAFGITSAVDDGGGAPTPAASPMATATVVTIGPSSAQTKVQLPPAAQAIATAQAREDALGDEQAAHSDLKDSTPQPESIQQANNAEKPSGQPTLPAIPPQAAQQIPGCRTILVRNFSSRNGAPILLFVIHFTVSKDSGWAGILGNVKWFDSAAASASSNWIIDRLIGACATVVQETDKAWAQAGFNPWSLSVEVTANGTEGSLVQGAGKARLIALMRRAHDVYKIPYRHGKVSGCRVVQSGFVIHKDLGQCGGGHVDVTPYSIDPLISTAATSPCNAKCVRTRSLRSRHAATHAELRRRSCSKPSTASRCVYLYKHNDALHRAADREHIKL